MHVAVTLYSTTHRYRAKVVQTVPRLYEIRKTLGYFETEDAPEGIEAES